MSNITSLSTVTTTTTATVAAIPTISVSDQKYYHFLDYYDSADCSSPHVRTLSVSTDFCYTSAEICRLATINKQFNTPSTLSCVDTNSSVIFRCSGTTRAILHFKGNHCDQLYNTETNSTEKCVKYPQIVKLINGDRVIVSQERSSVGVCSSDPTRSAAILANDAHSMSKSTWSLVFGFLFWLMLI